MGQPLDNSLACPLLLCGSPQVTEKKAQGSRPSATRQHLERHAPASRAPGQARPSARKAPAQAWPSDSPAQSKRQTAASHGPAWRLPRSFPGHATARPGVRPLKVCRASQGLFVVSPGAVYRPGFVLGGGLWFAPARVLRRALVPLMGFGCGGRVRWPRTFEL